MLAVLIMDLKIETQRIPNKKPVFFFPSKDTDAKEIETESQFYDTVSFWRGWSSAPEYSGAAISTAEVGGKSCSSWSSTEGRGLKEGEEEEEEELEEKESKG